MPRNFSGLRKTKKERHGSGEGNDGGDSGGGGERVDPLTQIRGEGLPGVETRTNNNNSKKGSGGHHGHSHGGGRGDDEGDEGDVMLKSFFTSWLPKVMCFFLLIIVGAVAVQGYYARTLFTYVTDNVTLNNVLFGDREYVFLCTDTRGTDGAKKEAPLPDWYYKLAKSYSGVAGVVDCSSKALTKSKKTLYETFPSVAKFKHVPPVMFYGVAGTVTGLNTEVFRRKSVQDMIAYISAQNEKRYGLVDVLGNPSKIKALCKSRCVLWLTRPRDFPFLKYTDWKHAYLDGTRFEPSFKVANEKSDPGTGVVGAVIWETPADNKRHAMFFKKEATERIMPVLDQIVEDPAYVATKRGTLLKPAVGNVDAWITVSMRAATTTPTAAANYYYYFTKAAGENHHHKNLLTTTT